MDDDVVVDFIRIYQQVVEENEKAFDGKTVKNMMFGYIQMGLPVQRSQGWKWALSKEEFDSDFHPTFLSGWAYVTTPNVAKKLVKISKEVPVLWIDDVWVTGILAGRANIQLKSLNMFYTFYNEHIQCCVFETRIECDFLVGPSGNNLTVIRKYGELSQRCSNDNLFMLQDSGGNSSKRRCNRRKDVDSIIKNCHVQNPYFLPRSQGIAEVF